jgi:hypothetical protein
MTKPGAEVADNRPVPLPQKPYDVQVIVGFAGAVAQDPAFRSECEDGIRRGLSRMYGGMWSAELISGSWLQPAGEARLRRLSNEDMVNRYPEGSAEKVILISVEHRENRAVVSAAEFDVRVQELSPVLTAETLDDREIPQLACRLARDSFRPVLMLKGPATTKEPGEYEFELQAGSFTPPDPSAAQIAQGDVLRPFLRQMERRDPTKLRLLQRLDLCYIRVTLFNEPLPDWAGESGGPEITTEGRLPVDPGVWVDSHHVRGVLISHGAVPFGGRGRAIQQIALRQRPAAASSRVQLVLQTRTDRPLICYRVDQVNKLRHDEETIGDKVRVLTDRNGELEIAVDPANPTSWLYVYSGSLLLARVPYAPGLIPHDTIKLPDDSLRLGVEGELYLFRDELIDSVASRAVAMNTIRKSAASGDQTAFAAALAQLDALPAQKDFEQKLNTISTNALNKVDAQTFPSRTLKRKVEKLTTAMSESLTAFFANESRVKDLQELQRLRDAVASGTPVTPPPAAAAPPAP